MKSYKVEPLTCSSEFVIVIREPGYSDTYLWQDGLPDFRTESGCCAGRWDSENKAQDFLDIFLIEQENINLRNKNIQLIADKDSLQNTIKSLRIELSQYRDDVHNCDKDDYDDYDEYDEEDDYEDDDPCCC